MKYSKKKAWTILILSMLIVSGLFLGSHSYLRHVWQKRQNNPKFRLVAIAQINREEGEPLNTGYIAEWLGLSHDCPISLFSFNVHEATQRLNANPLIKRGRISKIYPGTLLVEYQLRKPIAFLGDYTNTALDQEAHLFPFHPFFTPKNLPEIILGPSAFESNRLWGHRLNGTRLEIALKLYHHLMHQYQGEALIIRRIDVSKTYALSYGQRQIVVILEERQPKEQEGHVVMVTQKRTLRLGSANWIQGLSRYGIVRTYLAKKGEGQEPLTIDLRVPRQALLSY